MTQEEKQILLIDLCARLPYNPKVKYAHFHKNGDDTDIVLNIYNAHKLLVGMGIYHIKPYLRPMSSMTEEEEHEIMILWNEDFAKGLYPCYPKTTNFYLSHHLDYRGLIPMGLAIEVTKENNPY